MEMVFTSNFFSCWADPNYSNLCLSIIELEEIHAHPLANGTDEPSNSHKQRKQLLLNTHYTTESHQQRTACPDQIGEKELRYVLKYISPAVEIYLTALAVIEDASYALYISIIIIIIVITTVTTITIFGTLEARASLYVISLAMHLDMGNRV